MKKFLYIGGGSLLLLAALLFGSFYAGPLFASAHSSTTSTTTTQSAATAKPKTTTPKHADVKKDHDKVLRKFVREHKDDILTQIAPQLHLTKDQLTAKLKSGEHLDKIAKEQKISKDSLKTIIINSTDTVINKALQAKKIDQTQATDLMNRVHANPFEVGHALHHEFDGHKHDNKHMKANGTKKSASTKKNASTTTNK